MVGHPVATDTTGTPSTFDVTSPADRRALLARAREQALAALDAADGDVPQ